MRDAKPGETWRVTEARDDHPASCDWLVLDGDLLETAHEIGYEGSCVILVRRDDGYSRPFRIPASELSCLTTQDDLARLDAREPGIWEKVSSR